MLAVQPLAAAPITLKFATVDPDQSPVNKNFKAWAEKVMKDSEGTIKIDIYAGGTMGRNPQVYLKSLMDGVVEMAWMVCDYTPGKFPDDHVFHLPFLAETQSRGSARRAAHAG